MARPTVALVEALRVTAARLEGGATEYRWTHMGACNCGQLAQTITKIPRAEIHRRALERAGDWGEQAVEHCPTSGLPIDHVLDAMLEVGLELGDVTHLERLSDRRVLRRLPIGERNLSFRERGDVVRYMREWADLLDEERARVDGESGVRRVPRAPASPSDLAASGRASGRSG